MISFLRLPSRRRQGQTLAGRLTLFALGLALPMLLLATGAIWQQRRADRGRAEAALVAQAHSIALLLDREFAGAEHVLLALARSGRLAAGDIPAFWDQMRNVAEASGALAINLVAAEGRVVASTDVLPGERPAMIASGSMLRALETGRTVIGNLFNRPFDGSFAVGVTVPVRCTAEPGQTPSHCALGFVLPRARMLAALTDQRLPPQAAAAVMDRENRTVARTLRDGEFVGTRPAQALLDAMRQPAGMIPFHYVSLEGRRVVAAYAQAPESGYRVKIVVPEEVFEAPLLAALWPTLLAGLLLLGAAVVMGGAMARRISEAFSVLGAADVPQRPVRAGLRELDDLADALSRKAGARARALAEMRSLFDASPVGMVRSDAGGRVYEANAAFLRMIGTTRAQLEAGHVKWDELTPPEWIGRDEAAIAEAARTGACAPYQKEYIRPDGTRVPALVFFAFEDPGSGRAAAFVVDLSTWGATEAALVRVHEQMRLAINAARMFFWDFNLVTGAVEWSPGLEEACALPPGGFGGTVEAFRALVHPEDLPRVEVALAAAIAGDQPYDTEFRMLRGDGGIRWVVARAIVQRDGAGRPVRMVGIDFDVTEQKQTELRLAESEARLRRVQRIGRIGGFDYDLRTGASQRSAEYRALHGLTEGAEDQHADWVARLHPDDRARAERHLREVLAEGSTATSYAQDYRIITPSGEVRWIAARGEIERDAEGRGLRLLGVHLDVSGLKEAEARLAETASRLQLAQEVAGIGVWERDLASGVATCTPQHMRLYGQPPGAAPLSYKAWLAIVHPEDRAALVAKVQGGLTQGGYETEFRIRRADGAERWLASRAQVMVGADGKPSRYIGVNQDITERKLAELALRASEERFRSFIEATPDVVYILDVAARRLEYLSPSFETVWGEPRDAIMADASRWDALLHEDDREVQVARQAHFYAEVREPWTVEYRIRRASDGAVRYIRDTAVPICDAAGRLVRVAGVAHDDTDRRQAELAEAASATLFRGMAEAMPALIFVADAEGRNTYTNARMQQYTGLGAEALAADGWQSIVHPDDLAVTLARWHRALSTGEPYENERRLRRADGAWRWHLARSVAELDDKGCVIRWLGAAIDVDDQHAAAAALNEAEAGLRLAVEAAELGVWSCNLRDGTAQASARCAALYGLAPDEVLDLDRLLAALHPDDQATTEAAIATALAERGRYDVEHRALLAEGDIRWRRATGRGEYGADGAALGLRGVVVDIDRRKRVEAELRDSRAQLEERVGERTRALTLAANELTAEMRRREQAQSALVQAQKLEALGQLTSGIAHDFNNVLAAVLGSLKLIRRRAPEGTPVAELARNGEAAAARATTLVRRLMAFARHEELAPAAVDTAALLAEADTLVRHAVGAGVRVVTEVPPGIWPLVVDTHQLEVALLNLAVNARDAMQGRGEVTLAARNAPAAADRYGEAPLGLRPGTDYVVLGVHDTGPGMPPEVLARATEAFFTTKPRGHGTGLGLAMVQVYAQQSGGVLHIESRAGQGTTVELWLPRGAEMPQPDPEAGNEELDSALHGNATILVVDDDEQVRLVVATTLRDLGYTVLEANSADTAMVQALATPRLDLMVTDVVMPGGDGPDLAAWLRAALPGVPVLFVTGFAGDHQLRGEVVLVKPYPMTQLGHQVLVALGRVQAPDRVLRQLRLPMVRQAYLEWRAQRQAAGADGLPRPDAPEMAALAASPHGFTVAVEWCDDGAPVLEYVRFGEALAGRLGHSLAGSAVEQAGADDGLFQGLAAMYRLCALRATPVSDYARYRFGDQAESLRFERLVLPLADDGGTRVTKLLGLALFDGVQQN